MAPLKNVLQEKDYEEALVFLAQHSKNRILIQNLTRKKNLKKLEYEIIKIVNQLKSAAERKAKETLKQAPSKPQKPAPVKDKPKKLVSFESFDKAEADADKLIIVRGKKVINPDALPEDIKKLWEYNRDSYKEIRALHEKLKLMEKATPETRRPLTERVAKLDDQIRANWEVIDAWQPGKKPEVKKDAEKIDHKRINANRKFISTNLKKLATIKNDDPKGEIIKRNITERYNELLAAGEKIDSETYGRLVSLTIFN